MVLIDRADRFLRGGDQESFTAQGFPAIRFTEMRENFAHQHQDVRVAGGVQYGDLPQYIDPAYLAGVTKVNVATLLSLALAPPPPVAVSMDLTHLSNDTTLRWSPVQGAAGYEILWRSTTAAQWEHAKQVGNVTQATLPVSKDDAIFGVRSVGTNGLRSVAVTPFRP